MFITFKMQSQSEQQVDIVGYQHPEEPIKTGRGMSKYRGQKSTYYSFGKWLSEDEKGGKIDPNAGSSVRNDQQLQMPYLRQQEGQPPQQQAPQQQPPVQPQQPPPPQMQQPQPQQFSQQSPHPHSHLPQSQMSPSQPQSIQMPYLIQKPRHPHPHIQPRLQPMPNTDPNIIYYQ